MADRASNWESLMYSPRASAWATTFAKASNISEFSYCEVKGRK
jgi:hypothetical protein